MIWGLLPASMWPGLSDDSLTAPVHATESVVSVLGRSRRGLCLHFPSPQQWPGWLREMSQPGSASQASLLQGLGVRVRSLKAFEREGPLDQPQTVTKTQDDIMVRAPAFRCE